jgi:hypothetical protein
MVDHLAAELTADTAPNRFICVARQDLRQRPQVTE